MRQIPKNIFSTSEYYDRAISNALIRLSKVSYAIRDFNRSMRNRLRPERVFDQGKFESDIKAWAADSFKKNRTKFLKWISHLDKRELLAYCAAGILIPSNEENLSIVEYIAVNALAHSSNRGKKITPYAFFRLSALTSKIQQSEVWVIHGSPETREFLSERLENLILRGTGRRLDQSIRAAFYRFADHDAWLKGHLGFTIEEAVEMAGTLIEYVLHKLEPILDTCKTKKDFEGLGLTFDQYGIFKAPLRSVVALAKDALTFRLEDIPVADKKILGSFLSRFSDKKYNPQNSFGDEISLYDKPIIDFDHELFLPFPSLIIEGLPEVFFRDLRNDKGYWSQNNNKKGKAAESRIIELLAGVFPRDFVFPNPPLKKGSELIDAVVLFEGVSLIIESKSRYLSREARNKPEIVNAYLKETMEKGINQTQNAESVLRSGKIKHITNVRGSSMDLRKRTVSEYLTLLILDERLSVMVIHDYLEKNKGSFSGYPFVVDINDLEYIVEEFNTPREFIKYLKDRQAFLISGKYHGSDELSVLGYYKINGRSFPPLPDDEKVDYVMLDQFWESYQEKYAEVNAAKAKADRISYFIDHFIERAHEAGPTSIVVAEELSKLTRTERRSLGERAFRKSFQSANDSKPHFALATFPSVDYGIVFLFTPEDRISRAEKLKTLAYLARIKLNNPKIIGIASEPANSPTTTIDYCLIYEPIEPDTELEHLSSQFFGDPKHFKIQEYPGIKKDN